MKARIHPYDFTTGADRLDAGRGYWLDGTAVSRTVFESLPARSADLLEVALAAYTADRLTKRFFKNEASGQRKFQIRMAVREPDVWNDDIVSDNLRQFLNWVSGDDWSFEFIKRKSDFTLAESETYLFGVPLQEPVSVSLFSGGLDSLAGLAQNALQRPAGTCVLVSGITNNRPLGAQKTQIRRIKAALKHRQVNRRPDVRHVAVRFGIDNPLDKPEEKSQRTRSVVFLALGTATAFQADTDTLFVYENGLGALNLPLNESQLGVDNYRGVHPRSLRMASELFDKVLGRKIQIENPCLFVTKAEMCEHLKPARLVEAIADTVSCDGYPIRVTGQHQCGYCTSCILRRMSIHAAGLGRYDRADGYRHDVLSKETTLNQKQIYGLATTAYQVDKLRRCLVSQHPWKSLTSEFPKLAVTFAELAHHKGLPQSDVVNRFLRLFDSYVREWDSFPANIKIASEEI